MCFYRKYIDKFDCLCYNICVMKLETKCPCKGCTKRFAACHDSCPDYIEYKADYIHKRELETMQRYDNSAHIQRVIQRSEKYGKK